MGDVPTHTNPIATVINKALRIIVDLGVGSIKAALVVQAPWLGWPVVSNVVDYFLNAFGDRFYIYLAQHETLLVIKFQTKAEKDTYVSAMDEFKTVLPGGDREAIEAARKKAEDALARLIHWDGSAPP